MSKGKGNLIEIQGIKIYTEYYDENKIRPVIVFLHDSLGCTELWRGFPKRLSEKVGCNFLIYDRQGYGKSDAMDTYVRSVDYLELEADKLNDLLNHLAIEDAILFGHSDGGSIALIAAGKYPERISAVVVEAAHVFVEEVTLDGIYKAIEAYKTTDLHGRLQKYHGDKVETLFKAWTETWIRSDYRDWNIEKLISQITCPILFVQGETDEYGTLEQVEKTIRQVGGRAEKYIIPNVGHSPHKEVPELIIACVSHFINIL